MSTGSLVADILIAVVSTIASVLAARYGWKIVIQPDDKKADKKAEPDKKVESEAKKTA